MAKKAIKGYKKYKTLYEEFGEDAPFRLYGEGSTPQAELISDLKDLVTFIDKSNPSSQEDYDKIKAEIKEKTDAITSHPNFGEFKEKGFEWQDSTIKLSDWQGELKTAASALSNKAIQKGYEG